MIDGAAKLGWANRQLSPLAAAEVGGNGGNGSAAAEADDEVLIAQLREQLTSRLRGAPQQAGTSEAWACLEVRPFEGIAGLRGYSGIEIFEPKFFGYHLSTQHSSD